jgi:hypothetical protein
MENKTTVRNLYATRLTKTVDGYEKLYLIPAICVAFCLNNSAFSQARKANYTGPSLICRF